MNRVAPRRLPFGLSIGSIFASFIMIGGIQVLIAGVRTPLSIGAVDLVNWIGKISHTLTPLRAAAPIHWIGVFEDVVLSAIFIACGLAIGSWLRRDTR